MTSWDRKELVVPNKDLITGKLLNRALSIVINRTQLEVGVSYDSDLDRARVILKVVVTNSEAFPSRRHLDSISTTECSNVYRAIYRAYDLKRQERKQRRRLAIHQSLIA